jgi:hypothetical protein
MPFVRSQLPTFVLAANKVEDRISKLMHRDRDKHLEQWDPFSCNAFEREAIEKAFFSLHNSDIDEIRRHGGDWATLAALMDKQTLASLSIGCECRGGPPVTSNASTKSLNVCLDPTDVWSHSIWLTVEVIHLCGGTDLDAWAIKNWLFSVDKSNYPYAFHSFPASERTLMCVGGTRLSSPYTGFRAGKFTVWDPMGGQLWPSTKDAQGHIAPYGVQLIDGGGPRALWQYPCP